MTKTKFKPGRGLLTWDEIRTIETEWKDDAGPGGQDIRKLVRHCRMMENMNCIILDENTALKKMAAEKESAK